MWDYGTNCSVASQYRETCNQRAYGTLEPPAYDLSKITTPVVSVLLQAAWRLNGTGVGTTRLTLLRLPGSWGRVHLCQTPPAVCVFTADRVPAGVCCVLCAVCVCCVSCVVCVVCVLCVLSADDPGG